MLDGHWALIAFHACCKGSVTACELCLCFVDLALGEGMSNCRKVLHGKPLKHVMSKPLLLECWH